MRLGADLKTHDLRPVFQPALDFAAQFGQGLFARRAPGADRKRLGSAGTVTVARHALNENCYLHWYTSRRGGEACTFPPIILQNSRYESGYAILPRTVQPPATVGF